MHSVAIQSDCFKRSFWFYTEVLNLPVHRAPFVYKTRQLTWINAGPTLIELYSTKDSELAEERPGRLNGIDHIAFTVDSLADITEVLNHHDIPITRQPFLPPSGDPEQPWVMFTHAPEGTEIQFRGTKGR